MNSDVAELLTFFKYQSKLKMVLRNNWSDDGRRESSAEHSWSVAMMVWMLSDLIKKETDLEFDQMAAIKMALVHDLVEIEAGDVGAWDLDGREAVKESELEAINSIASMLKNSHGSEIHSLWIEHEERQSLESKVVKACDQLCPLIYRVVFSCSNKGTGMNKEKLNSIFLPLVSFSETTNSMYVQISREIEQLGLFDA